MLWLNFSGTLNVNEASDGFSTSKVGEHDRLTISDTAGKVLWFLMTDSVPGVECEFQDPEWSADGRFVVALGGFNAKGSKGCDEIEYGIFATRLSDNATFFLVERSVGEYGDPHLWVGPSKAEIDSTDSLQAFFGTDDVETRLFEWFGPCLCGLRDKRKTGQACVSRIRIFRRTRKSSDFFRWKLYRLSSSGVFLCLEFVCAGTFLHRNLSK